jgi:hypothetical protein
MCEIDNLCQTKPVRLRLSTKSASQPTVFFSHKKLASSTFNQPDQLKRTGCYCFFDHFSLQLNVYNKH